MHVEIPRLRDATELNNDGMTKLGDVITLIILLVITLLVVCTASDADCPSDKPRCVPIEGADGGICFPWTMLPMFRYWQINK